MDAIKRISEAPAAVAGLFLLLVVIAMAVSAVFSSARSAGIGRTTADLAFSNPRFLLGTDNSGRDIARNLLRRTDSLLIGGVATAIAILIGILVGAFAGYYGGWGRQCADAHHRSLQTLPNFVLLLVLVAVSARPDYRHHRGRCGVVAGTGAADPSRIPLAGATANVQAGRTLGMKASS